jgi:hypothetical protein
MKVRVEFQYFEGCPNHESMKTNLIQAIRGIEDKVEIAEVLVEDPQTAARVMFRGSPTLLISGEDVEAMPAPDKASLSCRYYQNGVPSASLIRRKIEEAYLRSDACTT